MGNQLSMSEKQKFLKYLSTDENRVRRLFEMQRRKRSLQSKRNHLRSELQSIEKYLNLLDSQIKDQESFEQLSFNK
ncbi:MULTISPECIES: hypothetical protein [Prochlorococcus]|uniref:hypothetical protein n=1 Tax=Prochlorococcus TaxID=1218 RepID=UPI00126820BA|nr:MULTISPECIES: hypothetical protein [Prochlorococcus]